MLAPSDLYRLALLAVVIAAAVLGVREFLRDEGQPLAVADRATGPQHPPRAGQEGAGTGGDDTGPSDKALLRRSELRAVLDGATRAAAKKGARVQAALLLEGWRRPVVAAVPVEDARRQVRMWSVAKVVTAVALLRELGWGYRFNPAPPGEVDRAIKHALTRSENCPQRRLLLELQERAGGVDEARDAVRSTLYSARAGARLPAEAEPGDTFCHEYLRTQRRLAEPLAPTLPLGVATWRSEDAVRFLHALGKGAYGERVADYVLKAMRLPKRRSREAPPGAHTAPVDWGAGRALSRWDPAYKAGWGGARDGEFLTQQVAQIVLADGSLATLAVTVIPNVQPETDDPGSTVAPEATETIMRRVARALEPPD